jgi:outer membrane murein-binding lipoprotein Lpp
MKVCTTAVILVTLLFAMPASGAEKSVDDMSIAELRAYARQLETEVKELREQARSARESERSATRIRLQREHSRSRAGTGDMLEGVGNSKWGSKREHVKLMRFDSEDREHREILFEDDDCFLTWNPSMVGNRAAMWAVWFHADALIGNSGVQFENAVKIDDEYIDIFKHQSDAWQQYNVKPRAVWADGERPGEVTAEAIKAGKVRLVVERTTEHGAAAMVLQRVAGDRLAIVHHRFAKGHKAPTDAELDALLAKIPDEPAESR